MKNQPRREYLAPDNNWILMAYADRYARLVVAEMLRKELPFQVETTNSSSALLSLFLRVPCVLTILDARLAAHSAFAAAQTLRDMGSSVSILITGSEKYELMAYKSGADSFLAYPFEPQEFLRQVRQLLGLESGVTSPSGEYSRN